MPEPKDKIQKARTKRGSDLGKKLTTRLFAVQAVFQMESIAQNIASIIEEFEACRFGEEFDTHQMYDGDRKFFSTIVKSVLRHQNRIDQCTDKIMRADWPLARIDPTLRAIFRTAAGEALLEKTPPKVVISEYVEITRSFYPEGREISFANAVIERIVQELCPESAKRPENKG